jgi:hypothetical protein
MESRDRSELAMAKEPLGSVLHYIRQIVRTPARQDLRDQELLEFTSNAAMEALRDLTNRDIAESNLRRA